MPSRSLTPDLESSQCIAAPLGLVDGRNVTRLRQNNHAAWSARSTWGLEDTMRRTPGALPSGAGRPLPTATANPERPTPPGTGLDR
jgi:hypothetical protein